MNRLHGREDMYPIVSRVEPSLRLLSPDALEEETSWMSRRLSWFSWFSWFHVESEPSVSQLPAHAWLLALTHQSKSRLGASQCDVCMTTINI